MCDSGNMDLKVLVLGGGGREHALAWALAKSERVSRVFVAPGNGGTATAGGKIENVAIGHRVDDFPALIGFAQVQGVGLVVPGPEQPLVDGVADAFRRVGIATFGPSGKAAQMEGSKAFSKDFMRRHGIPTAAYERFTDYEQACAYVRAAGAAAVVVKASGLAGGKGVLLPRTAEEAEAGLRAMLVDGAFGAAGAEVVVEERLEGAEISVLAVSDGYTVAAFPAAQDHKRALDNDEGGNTGGMGAYAPAAVPSATAEAVRAIIQRTVDGMRRDGLPFVGCLFTGFMLTADGPRVLEYNVRFGDPETEAVLPLLESDLADVLVAACEGRLDAVPLVCSAERSAATVVMASAGYPGAYATGGAISLGAAASDTLVFHSGTARRGDGEVVTTGGRVVAVTGVGRSLQDALQRAYAGVDAVRFEGAHWRTDIGKKAGLTCGGGAGLTYADAGVDIDAGNRLVDLIKPIVRRTRRVGTDAAIGGFGGLFDLAATGFRDPVLVAATDGVGTKLVIAHALGAHRSVGVDLVAMQVNDLVVQGAEPLFFLDYYACGRLDVGAARDFVQGVADGCVEAGCALVGGETAEMPGLYAGGAYDVAGFAVGAVERADVLPRAAEIGAGDVLVGLASSGVHSNGFSLVRRVVERAGLSLHAACPWDAAAPSLGAALLEPTRIYVRALLPLVRARRLKAMAHITGGGFTDNVPRVLPPAAAAELDAATWPLPPVFRWLRAAGAIAPAEMARTFNCGLGMVLVVAPEHLAEVLAALADAAEPAYVVGRVTAYAGEGERVVVKNTEQW
ncbi:hypothetical protein H4R26_001212 [Coemansia thaxteri]|uniref:ATP-grasp domain-containing protein n=1 Tax=Coemansia thaxteri TaxID=2663907 RepID=A0A9W8BM63_9FUNG|nr:hypothetical protein H4R26_001212 [Coemansia thaxteri]KAJ2486202.1 hypothetical protein EV174_001266 [Coemansia sp. RSA 2320]